MSDRQPDTTPPAPSDDAVARARIAGARAYEIWRTARWRTVNPTTPWETLSDHDQATWEWIARTADRIPTPPGEGVRGASETATVCAHGNHSWRSVGSADWCVVCGVMRGHEPGTHAHGAAPPADPALQTRTQRARLAITDALAPLYRTITSLTPGERSRLHNALLDAILAGLAAWGDMARPDAGAPGDDVAGAPETPTRSAVPTDRRPENDLQGAPLEATFLGDGSIGTFTITVASRAPRSGAPLHERSEVVHAHRAWCQREGLGWPIQVTSTTISLRDAAHGEREFLSIPGVVVSGILPHPWSNTVKTRERIFALAGEIARVCEQTYAIVMVLGSIYRLAMPEEVTP